MRNKSPCYLCHEREIGCHGKCERYQAWLAEKRVEMASARQQRSLDYRLEDIEYFSKLSRRRWRNRNFRRRDKGSD